MARDQSSILHPRYFGSVFQMLDDMPQNRCLYCDSGLWRITDEANEVVHYKQDVNETFLAFITRAYEAGNIYMDWNEELRTNG